MTNQQPKAIKKKWYTTWWGILILVLGPLLALPILIVIIAVIVTVATVDFSDTSSNQTQSDTSQQQDTAAEDEAAAKELTKVLIEGYVPTYCENHQDRDVPLPNMDGSDYGQGKNNLTTDECRLIITYLVENVGTSAEKMELISQAKISIGMNRHELLMSWGAPDDTNTTNTAYGSSTQWIYGNPLYGANYVYMSDDVITTIQN